MSSNDTLFLQTSVVGFLGLKFLADVNPKGCGFCTTHRTKGLHFDGGVQWPEV